MIQEDAINFQKQLVNLFRTFEVNVAVGLHSKDDDYGVSLRSQDPQVDALNIDNVVALAGKKKDVLSG